ncbi:MAG: hypothetical protein ACYDCO_13030 [Armatimonadota bacterium]
MIHALSRPRWWLLVIALLLLAGLAFGMMRVAEYYYAPASWTELQHWALTAAPGDMLRDNPELGKDGGKHWTPLHTQDEAIPFLYSDAPEYLHNDTVGKALARMRLTEDAACLSHPERKMQFGVGLHHINKTVSPGNEKPRPETVSIVVRLLPSVSEGKQIHVSKSPATVRLVKGAYGTATGMPVFAGKQCAVNWFTRPNAKPATVTLRPGEAHAIFSYILPPDTGMNGMFDLETDNAYFLEVYVVFGQVRDFEKVAFAPYDNTIGTNCGVGPYWKRTLRPARGTPAFDAADAHRGNKVHFRFYRFGGKPPMTDMQYLVDQSWDLRPEGPGKQLIRSKGGQRRPFKGDYNVEYTVVIPVRSGTGKPARFAIVDTQRYGMFGGAAKTNHGVVQIPRPPADLVHASTTGEGVLLDVATVSSRTPVEYTFKWFLTGGSYGDQEFMLIPLGEQ